MASPPPLPSSFPPHLTLSTTLDQPTNRRTYLYSDPSIKAILLKIDTDGGHAYIIEDLDESHLVVKEAKLAELKMRLDEVLRKTSMQEREEETSDDEGGEGEAML